VERVSDIDKAIGAHVHWVSWLRQAIIDTLSVKNGFDIDLIRTGKGCEFGKWLDSSHWIGRDPANTSYVKVQRLHAEFHETSARIVELATSGKLLQAYSLLYGDFLTISGRLILALRAWQTELLAQIWWQQDSSDQ